MEDKAHAGKHADGAEGPAGQVEVYFVLVRIGREEGQVRPGDEASSNTRTLSQS